MKIKSGIRLISFLCPILILFNISLAFSSWILINANVERVNLSISAGVVVNGLNGIEVTSQESEMKTGKYFYYGDKGSSPTFDLIYNFQIDPNVLNEDLKHDNGNGGYSFKLEACLNIDNQQIFKEDVACINSILLKNETINETIVPSYNEDDLLFSLNFTTKTTTDKESFKLTITFNNKLILKFKDLIVGKNFLLQIAR